MTIPNPTRSRKTVRKSDRTTLYSSVRPVSAGSTCVDCGERMVFTNRTNRTTGTTTCSACGAESVVGAVPEPLVEARGWMDEPRPRQDDAAPSGLSRWREDLTGVTPERAALIGGAAALGVVLGAAAARAVRNLA
jgi:predicted RNA-binding Zn-ribbon protein involved in translation (DUF1610 family)